MKVSYSYNELDMGNDNLLDMLVTSATQIWNWERLQVQNWESLAARHGQRSLLKSCREGKGRGLTQSPRGRRLLRCTQKMKGNEEKQHNVGRQPEVFKEREGWSSRLYIVLLMETDARDLNRNMQFWTPNNMHEIIGRPVFLSEKRP